MPTEIWSLRLRAESEAGGGGGGGRHAALIKARDLHLAAGMHIPGVVSGEIYFFTGDIPFIKWSYNMMNTVSPVKMMGPPSLRAPGSHLLRLPLRQHSGRVRFIRSLQLSLDTANTADSPHSPVIVEHP